MNKLDRNKREVKEFMIVYSHYVDKWAWENPLSCNEIRDLIESALKLYRPTIKGFRKNI